MARTSVFSTNFDSDTDGSHPAGFTDLGGGNGQIRVVNPTGTAGKFRNAFGSYIASRCTATYSDDQYASIAITGFSGGNSGEHIGVVVRMGADANPSDDGYFIRVTDNGVGDRHSHIEKRTNGSTSTTFTTGTSQDSETWAENDILTVEVTGSATTTIKVFRGSSLVNTVTDASSPFTTGKPGICSRQQANATLFGDSFDSGDVTADLNTIERVTIRAGVF